MAGGGLDEGVLNLERFIGILMNTIEQVQDHTSTIEDHANTLEDLDNDAEGALNDLTGALDDFEEGLESSEGDSVQEIGELRQLASEGEGQRLVQAESDTEQAGSEFESGVQEGRDALEQAQGSLTDDGFEQLGSTVEGVISAIGDSQQQAESDFEELDSAVAGAQTRSTEALSGSEDSFGQTVDELTDKKEGLVTDAGDCVTAFDGLGDDIDGQARTLAGELEGLYGGWTGDVDTDAEDFNEAVETLMSDTAAYVDTVTEDQLQAPAETVLDDAIEPYLQELAELQSVLDEARTSAEGDLLPLVDELERALGVVATIDQLLNAVE